MLDELSPELAEALGAAVGRTVGLADSAMVGPVNTGGGCMVLVVDLSQDGRGIGRQLWLTREDDWFLGFYDFAADPEDEGVVVQLPLSERELDDPVRVAAVVAGLLTRLGVVLQ